MFEKVICVFLIAISTSCVQSKYEYNPLINGWLAVYKYAATWTEAYERCYNDGAMLASPTTLDLRFAMLAEIIDSNITFYYTGTSAMFYPGPQYKSIDNIPIEDMPLSGMTRNLDVNNGRCAVMTKDSIVEAQCDNKAPFMCYKKYEDIKYTVCGTTDTEYKFINATGSCYKMHQELKSWNDAFETCASEDAYLLVLNNEEELNSIEPLFNISENRTWIQVGLRQFSKKKDWLSVRGERMEQIFDKWYSNNNSKTLRIRQNYNCGNLRIKNGMKILSDSVCEDKEYFICEKDPSNIRFVIEDFKELKNSPSVSVE
ncbi:lymphocyte antigen 75-like [Anticarsia gemmatalis]|uniref:lymphocyte antigen 75-like n=1 Tax=Anticarsia gemmatalis TaxID=129554 RepID=UPI003F7597AA